MGILLDALVAAKCEELEKQIKEAYQMGFRDGRLCPADLRPCEVDGKPALFHRFADEDQALLRVNVFCLEDEMRQLRRNMDQRGIIPSGCSSEVVRRTYALVEYQDGSIGKVAPELVQFTDREVE
jgi:hypothetical protein